MGKQWKQWQAIFLGTEITADGDCSHKIKRHLLLGRKAIINLDSILKSRDITLPTKVRLVKTMVFPAVMYRCESWTIKKAEHRRIDAFELWCWRRLLRGPWTARRSNQSILKEINPEYSLEALIEAEAPVLWTPDVNSWLIGKDPDAGKGWRREEKGTTEMRWLGGITDSTVRHLSKLWEMVHASQWRRERCSPWSLEDLATADRPNNKGPGVKTLCFHFSRHGWSLVWELRLHKQ